MSGTNPFRRKVTVERNSNGQPRPFDHAPVASNPDSGIPPIDTDVARPKTKTVKTVRIISPHSAEEHDPIPDEFYDASRRLPVSPPPEPVVPESSEDESPEDPFGVDSEGAWSGTEDEGTRMNTLSNAGEPQRGSQLPTSMPANPFAKTLATLEDPDSLSHNRRGTEQKPAGGDTTSARPQYDVDDFKRLLLTGEKNVSKPSGAPLVSFGQSQTGDNSSNTDTSSVSRQSFFEPAASTLRETPRTSPETSISEDEKQRLVEASELRPNKLKPDAPKHRHGKLVNAKRPQTVSSEDQSLSFATPAGATSSFGDQLTPRPPISPSDRNKVLPPLPSPSTSSFSTAETRNRLDSNVETRDSELGSITQKRAPAPPPSRRSRPMSIGSMNSGRSEPISEDTVAESMQISSSPSSKYSNAPAPPPPRRSNTLRGDSSSSIPTVASAAAGSDSSLPGDQSPTLKARPPVPTTRSPTVMASKGPNRTPPASASPSMAPPPPPPPPRRRGSSQSSNNYTPSRLSGSFTMPVVERLRSDSGASSISQLQMTNLELTSEPKEQKDVIADLTALQREVDELRGKMR